MEQVTAGQVPTIDARLLATSSHFARTAVSAYVSESWDVFYVHLATGLELLLKGVLARLHPVLIADPKLPFDVLLHLSGFGRLAKTPASSVRTIAVTDAVKRVAQVVENYVPVSSRVQLVLDTRNGIVHFGEGTKTEHEAVLGDVARYVAPLLSALGTTPAAYWGDSAELVDEHARRQLDALEAAYSRKIEAARDRYSRFVETMEDDDRDALISRLERTDRSAEFDAWPSTCPACDHQGTAYGRPEPEWKPDWDVADGEAYASGAYVSEIRLHVSAFDCRVCRLSLDSTLCGLAGLRVLSIGESEYDVSDASEYFTPSWEDDDDWGR